MRYAVLAFICLFSFLSLPGTVRADDIDELLDYLLETRETDRKVSATTELERKNDDTSTPKILLHTSKFTLLDHTESPCNQNAKTEPGVINPTAHAS